MGKVRTHYDNLHVSRKADAATIRAAYRSLCQKHHPDKNPDQRERAEAIIKIINKAYDVLSDPEKRRQHDMWISAEEGRTASARPANMYSSSAYPGQRGGYRPNGTRPRPASASGYRRAAPGYGAGYGNHQQTRSAAPNRAQYGMRNTDLRSYGILKAMVLCRRVQNSGGIIFFISMLSGVFAAATYVVLSLY